jgi:hypothetical protein
MACQGAATALADEADFHEDAAFPEALAEIEGFHGKAMWAFLEHPQYWTGATLFLHSDNIAETAWKKRRGLPRLPAQVTPTAIAGLEHAISAFFRREGRGRNCKVEVFRRRHKEYFFAYPEDYAQSGTEWIRNALSTRARHPAFELIFVYSQAEGSLDIHAPRNTKYVDELQELFAKTVLGLDELDPSAGESRVYSLEALADRDFVFQCPPDCGIESAVVRKLRLNLLTGSKRKITLEADPTNNPKAVYDLMDSLNLPPFHATQAEIRVNFASTNQGTPRPRTFRISYPNWCALHHEGHDLLIRQMLMRSGIEPMPAIMPVDRTV